MSKRVKIIIFSVIGLLVAAVFVFIILENVSNNKYTIVNNTDMNITSLKVVFEWEEDGTEISTIYEGSLNKGDTKQGHFDTVDFSGDGGEIGVYVTFEGHDELECYDGYILGKFNGKVNLEFYQNQGQYRLKQNASVGLFNNTENTALKNSEIEFIFDEDGDDWDYVE
ncbi:MAG: hypothetical protein IKP88_14270 [Lachnospiraceae bacterium]|nr:hypothetical protein [Lachnospiraceae bacterium]